MLPWSDSIDTEWNRFAVDAKSAFFAFRKEMSGVSFGVKEGKDYSSVAELLKTDSTQIGLQKLRTGVKQPRTEMEALASKLAGEGRIKAANNVLQDLAILDNDLAKAGLTGLDSPSYYKLDGSREDGRPNLAGPKYKRAAKAVRVPGRTKPSPKPTEGIDWDKY